VLSLKKQQHQMACKYFLLFITDPLNIILDDVDI